MRAKAFLILTLLLSTSFAFWTEYLTVFVADKEMRPIENATVVVRYHWEKHDFLDGRLEKLTNSEGLANMQFSNTIEKQFEVEKDGEYSVDASYLGAGKTRQFQRTDRPPRTELFQLPVDMIYALVLDQEGRPIEGADVSVLAGSISITKKSRGDGYALLQLPGGTYRVAASFGQLQDARQLTTKSTTYVNFTLPLHDLALRVVDEKGSPLQVAVEIAGFGNFSTDENGALTIRRFPASAADITIIYGFTRRSQHVSTSASPITLVFDLSSPTITGANITLDQQGRLHVNVEMSDFGQQAGGLAGAYVRYSVNNGPFGRVRMFQSSAHLFSATIAAQEPGSRVLYYIETEDRDGNSATSATFTFDVPFAKGQQPKPIAPPSNQTSQTKQNATGIFSQQVNILGAQVSMPILLVAVAALLAVLYKFAYLPRKEGRQPEHPQKPPAFPPPAAPAPPASTEGFSPMPSRPVKPQ